MKQSIIYFLASLLISFSALAQGTDGVLVDPNNGTTRDASAVFQAQSTSQGVLVSRMTAAQRIAIPVSAARDGLMVYQTDAPAGFYYYNGATLAWVLIANTTSNLAGVTAGTGLTGGGTSGTITVNAVGDNGLTTNADDIDLGGNLTQAATTITQDGSETFTISNTGTGNTTINLTSTGDFDVQDNGVSALFVRDNAFVGVGTNAPNSPFTVRTNVATANARTSSLANAVGDVLFELSTSKGATTNAVGDITTQIGQSYNAGTITEGIRFFRGGGASDGAMAFVTNNGTERMRINSAGLVGINTNNPLASLHVKNGKAFINKSNVDTQTANYANADLVLGDNTTSRSGYTGGTGSHLFLQSSDKSTITALDESNNLGQIAYQNLVWTIGEDIGWGTQVIKAPNLAGTGGRVVVADASGNLSATTSTGAGIVSGSGTQNYVTKWNNATGTTIGNSQIFDNGTNVGIGNAAPAQKLDVSGNIRATGAVYANANGAPYLIGGDDATLNDVNAANTVGLIGAQNTALGSLQLGTNSGSTISGANGNVGISSITPGAKLDVVGAATGSGVTIRAGGGGDVVLASGGSLFFDDNYSYAAGNYIRPIGGANTMGFFTSGGERMRILANGNVGIASTAPSEKLDVTGNIKASGIAYWGNGGTRSETRDDAGSQGGRSGFYETSVPAPAANWYTGASSWQHLIETRHSNTGNNYAMQFAGSFFDQRLYFRKTNNSATTAWSEVALGGANGPNSTWSLSGTLVSSRDDLANTDFSPNADDAIYTRNLGFNLTIDGTSYSQVVVSTNGIIFFGGAGSAACCSQTWPLTISSAPMIAFFYKDMQDFGTGEYMRDYTVGVAPARTYILWYRMRGYNSSDAIELMVMIHETSGLINVKYFGSSPTMNGQSTTVIGFQGAGGASAKYYPITYNGKVLDDNAQTDSWSISPVR